MAMVDMPVLKPYTVTDPAADMSGIRQRAQELGYLYLPGFLPADDVLDVRQDICTTCAQHDWLAASSDPIEAIVNPRQEAIVERHGKNLAWRAYYTDVMKHRSLHALNQHPRSMAWLSAFFAETCLAHPRVIARTIFPNASQHTTPPHQDFMYIGGSEDTWTMWIPLSACDATLGGLAVAPGSHMHAPYTITEALGAGGRQVVLEDEIEWHWNPMQLGDVILMHSKTVHQGRDNISQHLRLSMDCRYQAMSHPISKASLNVHMGWQSWDDIYQSWSTDDQDPLRHYWRAMNLQTV